jgi:hypothetical protein
MPDYLVRFCKELDDSTGHAFHTCQGEVTVRSAENEESAVAAAKVEFENGGKSGSWQLRATSIECEEICEANH